MMHKSGDNFGIKGFIPMSMIDWPGRITSVVFLAGCGFRCPACHNHRLVVEPRSLPDYPIEEVLRYVVGKRAWIDGITITGGEPTLRGDLPGLLQIFRNQGLPIKLDTNGSNPAMLEGLLMRDLVDGVSMDIKAPLTQWDYSQVAGVRVDVDAIRRSISILKQSKVDVVFRTTVIPGLVEEPQLARIRKSLGDVARFKIQGFRNVETLRADFRLVTEFEPERIESMRRLFELPGPANGNDAFPLAV